MAKYHETPEVEQYVKEVILKANEEASTVKLAFLTDQLGDLFNEKFKLDDQIEVLNESNILCREKALETFKRGEKIRRKILDIYIVLISGNSSAEKKVEDALKVIKS